MTIPDFQAIMLPLLQFASDGREHRMDDSVEEVASMMKLSDQERDLHYPSPSKIKLTIFAHRMAWARTHLKQAGLVEDTRRSHFRITERVLLVLADRPSRITTKLLEQFPEYVDFKNRTREKSGAHSQLR